MLLIPLLSLPLLASALSLSPTLYTSQPTSSQQQITLTAPQSNAVLAHYLGVSHHERLPPASNSNNEWLSLLNTDETVTGPETSKVVVVLECGIDGCGDIIPPSLKPIASLPSLPSHSYLSLLALHLNRLSDSYSTKVWGLDYLMAGLKGMDGWIGWVGDELRTAMLKVGGIGHDFKAQVENMRKSGKWVGVVDTMDKSAEALFIELEQLTNLVDSFGSSGRAQGLDEGPQGSDAQSVVIHIKGLTSMKDSPSSVRARTMLQHTLAAALESLQANAPSNPTVLLLSLPPYSTPLLRKRSPWLKAFNPSARYTSNTIAHAGNLHKRAADDGRSQTRAARTPTPIVPSTSICFTSASDVKNQTASCTSHGYPVLGVTTKKGLSSSCWVCTCDSGWAGEGCQKQDLSGDFTLLFFSGLGLLLVLFVSVTLLYNVGSAELPSTLASVSGAGGMKRD